MAKFYEAIFNEYEVSGLDSDNLDAGWLSAYRTHEQNVADGKLTDEEIKKAEDDLIELFKELQPEVEEEDPVPDPKTEEEILKLKNQNLLLQAERDVNAAKDMPTLERLKETYKGHAEATKLIDDRLLTMGAAVDSERKNNAKKLISESTDLEALAKMKEEWASDKAIVKLIAARIKVVTEEQEKQKVSKSKEDVINALKELNGKDVSYQWLREHGIEPTGDHMEVEGIKLYRQRFFFAYRIDVPNE